jgi:hypothetical protein
MLGAAFMVPFVMVFDHGSPDTNVAPNGWDHFYREGFMVFAIVFIPFFYMLASTLLMQIEVRNNAWKQVLAAPQSFFTILLAKFVVLQILGIAFLLIFNVYMAIGCALVDQIFEVNFLTYLNRWQDLLKINLLSLGSSVGISALSFWLALRFRNFIAPIALGFMLWLIGPAAALELKLPHFDKYVYVLPFTIVSKKHEHQQLFFQLLSMGYGVLFFTGAYLEFALKRISWNALVRRSHNVQVPENS